jgi:hypothetical protein
LLAYRGSIPARHRIGIAVRNRQRFCVLAQRHVQEYRLCPSLEPNFELDRSYFLESVNRDRERSVENEMHLVPWYGILLMVPNMMPTMKTIFLTRKGIVTRQESLSVGFKEEIPWILGLQQSIFMIESCSTLVILMATLHHPFSDFMAASVLSSILEKPHLIHVG